MVPIKNSTFNTKDYVIEYNKAMKEFNRQELKEERIVETENMIILMNTKSDGRALDIASSAFSFENNDLQKFIKQTYLNYLNDIEPEFGRIKSLIIIFKEDFISPNNEHLKFVMTSQQSGNFVNHTFQDRYTNTIKNFFPDKECPYQNIGYFSHRTRSDNDSRKMRVFNLKTNKSFTLHFDRKRNDPVLDSDDYSRFPSYTYVYPLLGKDLNDSSYLLLKDVLPII